MNDLTEYWNERARRHGPHYAVGFLAGPVENRLYRRAHVHAIRRHLLPLLTEAARERGSVSVLEVGCGWGRWARAFARWLGEGRVRYFGVDASEVMIEKAHTLGDVPGARFVHASATSFSAPEPVDVAFSFTVLQHVPWADQVEALRRMLGSLRPGGRLMIVELLGEGQDAPHVFPRTPAGWCEAVEEAGGEVLGTEGTMYVRAEVVAWNRSRWGNLLNRVTNLVKIAAYPLFESAGARREPGAASHVVVRAVRSPGGADDAVPAPESGA